MILAVVLVYLLMVVNFQSWIDPLIILMALPGTFAGILWMLFVTHTTLSVPALMGAVMAISVAHLELHLDEWCSPMTNAKTGTERCRLRCPPGVRACDQWS